MYYIDDLLNVDQLSSFKNKPTTTTIPANSKYSTLSNTDVELVQIEVTEISDLDKRKEDSLRNFDENNRDRDAYDSEEDDDDEIITPRALPVRFMEEPPK